jgi:single-strand DNA-binding protein
MAYGLNKVILIGNLGRDPEIRHTEGGAIVANFPLATTEYYKDKNGQRQEQTEWHQIVAWRSQAEYAQKYLKKGFTLMVEGKIRTRSWEDKERVKRYTTEIIADSFQLISSPRREDNSHQSESSHSAQTTQGGADASSSSGPLDDLPF